MKHKTGTLILILLFFFNTNLFAQWESLGNDIIPANFRVWSIKVAPDKSVWTVATFDDFPPTNKIPIVFRSVNEGQTWTNSEIPEGISAYGWDISPIDSTTAFIAVDAAGVFKTIDGGQNWLKVDSYNYQPFYVHFFNVDDGWVLATDSDSQIIMSVTEDGGNSWVNISYAEDFPLGTSLPVEDVSESLLAFTYSINSAYDYNNESIIVGTTNGGLWISNDKGKNWERKNSPLEELGLITSIIAMKDENTFMVAGDIETSNFNEVTTVNFTTKDGGETWLEGNSGVTASAAHYIPNSDSIFVMSGHNNFGMGGEGTSITYDYGASWVKLIKKSIIAMDFIDEETGYGTCCNNLWPTANGQIHKWNLSVTTSTVDITNSDLISIVPNPVTSHLEIISNNEFGTKEKNLRINILSPNGKVLYSYQVSNSEKISIPINDLPTGFYFAKITGSQKSIVKKFVKK